MKILFLRMASYFGEKNAHPENVMMPVDIAMMATIAENAGHETELVDTEAETWTLDSLLLRFLEFRPDLICVKAKSPSNRHLFGLFEHPDLVGLGASIIGFSHAFGEAPELFLQSGLPMACVIFREPESAFAEILARWKEGTWRSVQGIAYRDGGNVIRTGERRLLENLDELPRPKYEWFLNDRYFTYYPVPAFTRKKVAFMLATRGCPKSCIYCSPTLRQTYGTQFRTHSIERVVSEMKYLADRGIRLIQFRDDIFTLDRAFVKNLCERILSTGLAISWIVQTHVNHVDEDLLILMRRAGCVSIGFGLESGSERVLAVLKKHNDLDQARRVFRICRRIGIKTVGFFLVGSPGETLEEVGKTRSLIRELSPDLIQIALFTPYRGSKAYELLDKNVAALEGNFHHYNKVVHNFSEMDRATLESLPRKMYLEYIFTPSVFMRLVLGSLAGFMADPAVTLKMVFSGFRFLVLRRSG